MEGQQRPTQGRKSEQLKECQGQGPGQVLRPFWKAQNRPTGLYSPVPHRWGQFRRPPPDHQAPQAMHTPPPSGPGTGKVPVCLPLTYEELAWWATSRLGKGHLRASPRPMVRMSGVTSSASLGTILGTQSRNPKSPKTKDFLSKSAAASFGSRSRAELV